MKAKYFTAANRAAAEEMAENYFDHSKEDIHFEVLYDDEEGYCQLLAILGSSGEIANRDAQYGLFYEEDGVFLELYEKKGFGSTLNNENLIHHLSRKNIHDFSLSAVQKLIEESSGRAKIATAQNESFYGEDLWVVIAADEMSASARLLAPEHKELELGLDDAKWKLNEAGVKHGVDEQALIDLLKSKDYDNLKAIAFANPPENGLDGKLIFHFSTDERTGKPKELECGRVDYRSLDLYAAVANGQLLVSKTNATEGHPGISVKGLELKQKTGKEVSLPRGKNVTINDEKTELRATCSGLVEFVNNSINVSNVYKITGDVDLSVGNIDFDGSVHITGSVRSGNTVIATGGIIIDGSVEAAKIYSGGNVEVKGGMQGSDKGLIEADGCVKILYVERGTIRAGGPITVDVSMHSYLESGDIITLTGRRGAIIGGHVGASRAIVTNYIGAHFSNARTEVIVGVTPSKRARLHFLTAEIARLENEQTKLDKLDTYLARSKDMMNIQKWELLKQSSIENRKFNDDEIEMYTREMNDLEYELEHATEGRIHVFDTVYSGSKVHIGPDVYNASDEIKSVSFKYADGHVVYGNLELSKGA